MTSESRRILADAISEELPLEVLIEQKEKTRSSEMVEEIKEELGERQVCPECSNDMLFDEGEKEMYCPLGCHSHSYE